MSRRPQRRGEGAQDRLEPNLATLLSAMIHFVLAGTCALLLLAETRGGGTPAAPSGRLLATAGTPGMDAFGRFSAKRTATDQHGSWRGTVWVSPVHACAEKMARACVALSDWRIVHWQRFPYMCPPCGCPRQHVSLSAAHFRLDSL